MKKTPRKKAQPKKKWKEQPEPKKPEIPKDILDKFLKSKIHLPVGTSVKEIKCNPLWADRHRVNVWVERYEEGCYYPEVWIEYSYFLQFKKNKIIDKTIQPKPKKERIF